MRRAVQGFCAAMLVAISVVAAPAQEAEPLTYYTLDNGLEVILVPDHKVPKVAVTISYRVGGLNEPTGRSGFAHLFEHLMFSGTETYPDIDATYPALGINFNAYTEEDGTTYWEEGLNSTLPVILSVEADRMANIGAAVDQAELDLERSIVINEMRQNVLDSPGGSAYEALNSGLFPKPHPYSRAVIGSIPDIEGATLNDVKAFFSAYYTPNRAVLAIVGDFELEAAKAMIEDTFGRIPRGIEVSSQALPEMEPARLRIELEDVVSSPLIYAAFTGPNASSTENAALYVAADLLGNGEFGVLLKTLVNQEIATYAGAYWVQGKLGGRFFIYAGAGPGVSTADLEIAIRKVIADFLATPVDLADVERSRANFLLNDRTVLEGYQRRSEYITTTVAVLGGAETVLEDDPAMLALTVDEVEQAMRDVLKLDDASWAIISPGERGDYPAVLSEPSGEPQPLVVLDRDPVDIPVLAAGEPGTAELPPMQTATLSNGIEIVHFQMEDAPKLYLTAAVTGGGNNDPAGQEGLYSLAVDMAWRGAGDRDLDTFAKAAKDLLTDVSSWMGYEMSGVTLSVPPDNFEAAVELFADAVQSPRFDQQEWDVLVASVLDGLAQQEGDVGSVAARQLNDVLFVPEPGEAAVDTSIATVEAISLDDAKLAFRELFTPATMTIFSVGPLPVEAMVPALERRFGTWRSNSAGLEAKPHVKVTFPESQKVYVVPEAGASQAVIYVAVPAPGRLEAGYEETVAAANLLGADFASRLNSVIREEKGYSYGVGATMTDALPENGAVIVNVPVEVDTTGAALQEVFNGFASLIEVPVTDVEVHRTRTSYATGLASVAETAQTLFGYLTYAEGQGMTLADNQALLERMTQLDLKDVQMQAEALASLDQAIIVIAGDADAILPQLEAIGVEGIEVVAAEGP